MKKPASFTAWAVWSDHYGRFAPVGVENEHPRLHRTRSSAKQWADALGCRVVKLRVVPVR